MKKILLFAVLAVIILSTPALAQSPVVEPTPNWLVENYKTVLAILLGVYEVFVRYLPTVQTWSLLTTIMRIVNMFVPDRKLADPNERSLSPGSRYHSTMWEM